jgi:hypothetical protein
VGEESTPFGDLIVAYLRRLYAQCNELGQANEDESRPDLVQRRQPRLQHVYVDLSTLTHGGLPLAFARLALTHLQQQQVERILRPLKQGAGRPAQPLAEPDEEVDRGYLADDLKKVDHALRLKEGSFAQALNQPMTVLEAMQHNLQLVLLGDPGSGKSTLTQRLAGLLASAWVERLDAEEARWLEELKTLFGRWLLPLRLELSRWARQLVEAPPAGRGVASDLLAECGRLLATVAPMPPAALTKELLVRCQSQPASLLILLDGLDEVSDERVRLHQLQALADFRRTYPGVPLLITCRVKPWESWQAQSQRGPTPWPLHDWPAVTLAPLNPQAQRDFVKRWHDELAWAGIYPSQPAADEAQKRLLKALADPKRRDLQQMAGTPLLLTMMARINRRHGLPDSRAELYQRYVTELLWEWERRKLDDAGQLTSLELLLNQANVKRDMLEEALVQLAYAVHAQTLDQDTVEIPRHQLEQALRELYPQADDESGEKEKWAARLLRLIYERSGLVYAVDAQHFRFRHRTFQEYLAARWLTSGEVIENFRAKLEQEPWREVLFLAFGHLIAVANQADTALNVLYELLPNHPSRAAEWRQVLLLGEVYARLLGEQRVRQSKLRKTSQLLLTSVPALLTAAMQHVALPAAQRLEAGLLLTRGVNDPAGLGLDEDPPGLDDFIPIPVVGLRMGKYPVTNKQYKRFVVAGGYNQKEWWSKEGWQSRERYTWTKPRWWDDARFNRNSQPVVGVSWYEAEAYCAWLTRELRCTEQITDTEVVRLPSEAEWLAAAQPGLGRYPWGGAFQASHVNTRESHLEQTTPVHMYPAGATASGVYDLSGNVWEWNADWDQGKYPCLKGGAWYTNKERAEPSARFLYNPYDGYFDVGFRCVVVPSSR